jgi:hypothetical protein
MTIGIILDCIIKDVKKVYEYFARNQTVPDPKIVSGGLHRSPVGFSCGGITLPSRIPFAEKIHLTSAQDLLRALPETQYCPPVLTRGTNIFQ